MDTQYCTPATGPLAQFDALLLCSGVFNTDSGLYFGMLEAVIIKALYVLLLLSTAALVWVAGAVYFKVRQHMAASHSRSKTESVKDGETVANPPMLPMKEGTDV